MLFPLDMVIEIMSSWFRNIDENLLWSTMLCIAAQPDGSLSFRRRHLGVTSMIIVTVFSDYLLSIKGREGISVLQVWLLFGLVIWYYSVTIRSLSFSIWLCVCVYICLFWHYMVLWNSFSWFWNSSARNKQEWECKGDIGCSSKELSLRWNACYALKMLTMRQNRMEIFFMNIDLIQVSCIIFGLLIQVSRYPAIIASFHLRAAVLW